MATPEAKAPLTAAAGKRVEVPIKKATGPGDDKVHTWPHLVRSEFLCSIVIILLLLVWSLLVDAPLEEPANPDAHAEPVEGAVVLPRPAGDARLLRPVARRRRAADASSSSG